MTESSPEDLEYAPSDPPRWRANPNDPTHLAVKLATPHFWLDLKKLEVVESRLVRMWTELGPVTEAES
jgi:hypothetical protein